MNILGVNSGIGASVCLIKDNKIVFAVQEERLVCQKGYMGFPKECFNYLRENYSDILKELDFVSLGSCLDSLFSKKEFLKKYENRTELPKNKVINYQKYLAPIRVVAKKAKDTLLPPTPSTTVKELVLKELEVFGIFADKIIHFNHHDNHAATVYFAFAKDLQKKYLIFTLDGGGDQECATVSVGHQGKLQRLAATPSGNSIGNIYSNITHLLGFTPHEHEYKLMGMAPYVPAQYSQKVSQVFSKYIGLDNDNPLVFKRLTEERSTQTSLRLEKDLRLMRFDNIASGLQKFTEDLVLSWVKKTIEKTDIHDVLLSGGVFMNVKLNHKIALLDEVNSVNVFPSCGDESNSLGCAFALNAEKNNGQLADFSSYTLGPTPLFDLQQAKELYGDKCTFKELENPYETAAKLLQEGNIIARCAGPMEFGARALGNRSILADPIDPQMKERINFLIKQRDFWMPFAPAILEENANKYLKIPSSLTTNLSPYMMFAFDTTEYHKEMAACVHPYDKTARAQIVSKDLYPEMHKIISHFKKLTGRSAIMNTSFNFHGQPIVLGAVKALEVLVNSNLDYVLLENILVGKK